MIRSVSRVATALTNVSSVSQLLSFLVVCSDMISKGFGLVAFFASVKTIVRSTLLYFQYLVVFKQVAVGWCLGSVSTQPRPLPAATCLNTTRYCKYSVIKNDCRGFNRCYSPDHLVLQMRPHVISFYGVTSRIRFMFLLFPPVSRN